MFRFRFVVFVDVCLEFKMFVIVFRRFVFFEVINFFKLFGILILVIVFVKVVFFIENVINFVVLKICKNY